MAEEKRPPSSYPEGKKSTEGKKSEDGIWRTLSGTFSGRPVEHPANSSDEEPEPVSKAETWKLMPVVKDAKQRDQASGRRLGVTWKDLTIKGVASGTTFQENVLSQFNIPKLVKESRAKSQLNTIVDASSGCVKPGEMLLVLGRPGSGCTSLLKVLANRRKGFAEVSGDVNFGSLTAEEARRYRGQIVMNTEEELFFPTLTVGQTMDFATRLKVPEKLPYGLEDPETWRKEFMDFLMESMGIAHTKDTKVGNEYVRGVSGGERKRVSIIETLCCQASLVCWDNSTRGLDASTALEFTRALRSITDVFGTTTIVTLYQAGNGIFDLFDKVLVLDGGKQIYYGPAKSAKSYMDRLGFICDDAANVSDFLTGVVVPTERRIKPGHEKTFPRNATALQEAYSKSEMKSSMDRELDYPRTPHASQWTKEFCEAVQMDKSKHLPKSSVYTVSFTEQVKASVKRQYQIILGDKSTFYIKQGATFIQAVISGSMFYNAQNNSSGLFIKGGAIFLALLYNSILAMSEVTDSFFGRPVLAKHKNFAYYNPAAFCIAQIAADIPILFCQVTAFSLVLYWMTALKATAAAFFTFWFIVYLSTMVMTAFFRMVGAAFPNFDAASKVSGFAVSAYVTYVGYEIAKPEMHPWFVWIYWINPLAYAFDALLSNEFKNTTIPCANANLIPNVLPEYQNPAHQACAGVRGAKPFATSVDGESYLQSLSYSSSHIWRNVGIIIAWWVLFVATTIYFTLRWDDAAGSGGTLLIPRENDSKALVQRPADEENQVNEKENPVTADSSRTTLNGDSGEAVPAGAALLRNTSVFTWRNLRYTVNTPSGDRVLLDNVHGYVKPGMLGALMGSSGAGKTTLLDVLAQRKIDGTINGEILVDGRPLPVSFQRSAGYCEQLDTHEPFATVREALEFSALLRQSRDVPRAEKLAYVDTIIDLLELRDLEHTLIGRVGAGLTIEQRKRVTIGTELVSKPSILIFLDEPTSGLDGQAAYNTVRFLRKLADVGQAILVTIHQPSALLFAQFDTLLLLAKGGKTVYFGDIGDNADTIKDYFARNGQICPADANPAEFMIDVTAGSLGKGKDWNQVWLESPEAQQLTKDLDQIVTEAAGREPGTKDDGYEFAMPLWEQTKLVTQRMNVALYRNIEYINNKFALHIGSALFFGFTFWMIGNTVTDQQLILFAMFNFIFVAPGVIAQLQPLFLERRDLFEVREKKSKMYAWSAFVTGNIVSEVPYLCVCGVLYFVCSYYTHGFTSNSNKAGAAFFVMLMYEFIYTGMGQFVAAYAPNANFASLVNPLLIGILVSFCGVFVPYNQIIPFWRYWLYWLNPYNYLLGALLVFIDFDVPIVCKESEFAIFDPPANQTCGQYLAAWTSGPGVRTNLTNPSARTACRVCQYQRGSDYLYTVNLKDYYYGWRDAGICVIFAISSYALVYVLMKLRTKQSKKAE